jgi:hypothetical protein
MPSIDSISFDTSDLELQGDVDGRRVWHTKGGDNLVELYYIQMPPDIPVPLSDSNALLQAYQRTMARNGVGVVEATVVQLDGCPGVRMIVKAVQDPETELGRVYIGSFTIPRRDLSFVLKIECPEWGTTGVREAMVTGEFLRSGALHVKKDPQRAKANDRDVLGPDCFDGWVVDSSDPAPPHVAKSISDDPKYDARLPNHPLSRVRALLSQIDRSITVTAEVKAMPMFDPLARPKPWWRMW